MEVDGVFQSSKGAIVEVARSDGKISKRRRPEFVAVGRIAGELFEAEILVVPMAIEQDVAGSGAERGRDLRRAHDMLGKITEHLVRRAGDAVATDASGTAEEKQRAALLAGGHGGGIATRELVDGGVGE